jgi:polysaccharide biosynthesis transport protein
LIDNNKNNFDVRKYYNKILRRKYIIIIPFILITILSVVFALHQKPLYQTSTTIMVGEPKLMTEKLDRIALNVDQAVKLRIIKRVLLSQNNLIELINKLDLKNNTKLRSKALAIQYEYPNISLERIMEKLLIDGLKKQLKITTSQNNFITISAKSEDQDKVYQLVKTVSELFMDQVIENDHERLRQLIDFNAQQLRIYENKLRDSETKLGRYEQSLITNSSDGTSVTSNKLMKKFRSLQSIIEEDIDQKRNELSGLESNLNIKKYKYFLPVSVSLRALESQYDGLGQKILSELIQSSLTALNVTDSNEEVDVLRQRISKEIRDIVGSTLNIDDDEIYRLVILTEMTKRDLDMLNKKNNRLTDLINSQQNEIAQNPVHEGKLAKLKREVETNKEIYNTFLKESQGSYIGQALQKREAGYKFKIIEPAIRPMERVNSRKKAVIIGVLLGALIGIGLFSVIEILDTSFSEVDEIEDFLQLPVIGTVPKINYLKKSQLTKTLSTACVIATIIISRIIFK